MADIITDTTVDIMVDVMHTLAIMDTVVTIDTSVTMDMMAMDTDTLVTLHTLFPLMLLLDMVSMDTVMACI